MEKKKEFKTKNNHKNSKKQSYTNRSPLQDLKQNPKKISNPYPSSSAAAVSAPKACRTYLLSSDACTSSSRTNLEEKSKPFSKVAKNEPQNSKVLPRSKENEKPRKPFSQKSKHCSLVQRQFRKNDAKPVNQNRERSNLSSLRGDWGDKSSKGLEGFREKRENSQENCTPVGKVESGCGLESTNVGSKIESPDGGNSAVKTPPVEASLSPEIQCQSHSKMAVENSGATPVCYGAGHILSGVTNKRKCRRRGSLKGGGSSNASILFHDEKIDGNATVDLHDSSFPLPSEASVRWLLSPCGEGREIMGSGSRNEFGQGMMMVCDNNTSGTLDSLSGLLSAQSGYSGSGSGSVGNVVTKRANRDVILSPRKANEFVGILNHNISNSLIGENSALSFGSLNSGNIIQTPNSDCSSDMCFGISSKFLRSEVDSITDALNRVNVSPRNEMPIRDAPGLGSHFADMASPPTFIGPCKLEKNTDIFYSWVSDATLDNLALSQMRISWRDGILESDDLDCCCLLSEEEFDVDEQLMPCSLKENYMDSKRDERSYKEIESDENKENGLRMDNDQLSPELLDYEPCILARVKEKASSHIIPNSCAESICTDGGGLVASDDSDWTCHSENRLFQAN